MTLNLLIITTALLSLCVTVLAVLQHRPVTVTAHKNSDILFGDAFDIWRLVKVPEREAAQVIRRASRLNYKEIRHMYNQAGSVYILFQLCPPRDMRLQNNVA